MSRTRILFSPDRFRPVIALAALLSLFISSEATPRSPQLPPDLQTQLQKCRNADNLQDWIYDQLQWVARQPAPRASQLLVAVSDAWRSPRNAQECQAWLDLLVNEGYSLLQAGDIVRSTDAYTAAWQWARSHADIADESMLLNNILKPLGNNYTRLGEYDEADFIHHKALNIAYSLNDKEALAGTYSNLANTASNRGSPEHALEYCRLGLSQAPAHSAFRGLLLSEQADALSELGENNAARVSIQQAIVVLKTAIPDPVSDNWLFVAYQQAGDIDSADPRAALHYYTQALAIEKHKYAGRAVVHRRETAKLFLRLGDLYRRMHQPLKAIRWLDQCLSVLIPGKTFLTLQPSDLYAENTLADVLYSRALLFTDDNRQPAFSCFRLSFATERLLRRRLITGTSRERAITESRKRHETAIQSAWQAWSTTRSPELLNTMLAFMESSKAQLLYDELQQQEQQRDSITPAGGDSLRHRIRMLEKALVYYEEQSQQAGGNDSLAAVLLAQQRETELDLAAARQAGLGPSTAGYTTYPDFGVGSTSFLPEGQTEVRSFFSGSTALYQLGVDHHGVLFAERYPFGRLWQDSIRQFLHAWFEQGPNNMIDHPKRWFDQAYTIWRELFSAHPLLPGKDYVIIPDGPLDLLPIETLPTLATYSPSPARWPLVLCQTTISYAWSIRTLNETTRATGNSTGFAGFFLTDNSRHLPSLESVTREKEGIERSIHAGEWLTDQRATVSAFMTALDRSAVVHISTHAFSSQDSSSVPRIELYDRPVYMFQLSDLPRHPSLVVLSACRTGDGRMVTGEGAQSMARAFTSAGTNGVITGWWNVHDEVAARLMGLFYRELQKSVPPSEALSSAKRSWLADPAVPYLEKLPWYWAALNYQGTTAPLPTNFYTTAMTNNVLSGRLWWIFAGFVILIVLGLVYRLVRRLHF